MAAWMAAYPNQYSGCAHCFAPILCPLTAQGNSHSQDLLMTSSIITNHLHTAELPHVLETILSHLNLCIIILFLFIFGCAVSLLCLGFL